MALRPSPLAIEASVLAEPLATEDYLSLALWASMLGEKNAQLPPDFERVEDELENFIQGQALFLFDIESPYERAKQALVLLHRALFRRYIIDQTRIDLVLENGSYNCVSSAVVYVALAKAAGLAAWGVQTPDHAFAMVRTERGDIDVETTNILGFDPGNNREEFVDSFGQLTGYAYVPPEQYGKRSRIGEKALIGLIFHNRISTLEHKRDFGSALVLAVERNALEASDQTRVFLVERASNLAAGFITAGRNQEALSFLSEFENVYGQAKLIEEARSVSIQNILAEYGRKGNFTEGLAFAREARGRYGELKIFFEFDSMALNNQAVELIRRGRYRESLEFLDKAEAEGLSKPQEYPALRENAALAWVDATIRSSDFSASLELIAEIATKKYLDARKLEMTLQKAAGQEANRLARADPILGWYSASLAFERALAILPGSAELAKGLSSSLDNYARVTYNRFAQAFNAGEKEKARAILKEGLTRFPQSQLLKKELAGLD